MTSREARVGARGEQKRRWDAEHNWKRCACGQRCRTEAERCEECWKREQHRGRAQRRVAIVTLWNKGLSLKAISRELGSSKASISAEITHMRTDGWPVAYRHERVGGWRG